MNAKLTLSLDRNVVEKAKEFSKSRHLTLSKLVEGYLRQVAEDKGRVAPVTPLVAKLSGVIDADKIGERKCDYP